MIKLKNLIQEIYDTNMLENQQKYKIFCDLDGVLVGLDKGIKQLTGGLSFKDYTAAHSADDMFNLINNNGSIWWATLPWTDDGKSLWDFIQDKNTTILTSGATKRAGELAGEGKKEWCHKNLGATVPVIVVSKSVEKQQYAKPNHILIDDLDSNITQWKNKGGIAIHHKNTPDTLTQLKQLLNITN